MQVPCGRLLVAAGLMMLTRSQGGAKYIQLRDNKGYGHVRHSKSQTVGFCIVDGRDKRPNEGGI